MRTMTNLANRIVLAALLLATIGAATATSATAMPPLHDAIFVSNGEYVTIYPIGSNGNVAPIGTIDGTATGLSGSAGIAVDAGGNIYVANAFGKPSGSAPSGFVTVYPLGSNGNVDPIATISGPDT